MSDKTRKTTQNMLFRGDNSLQHLGSYPVGRILEATALSLNVSAIALEAEMGR